MKGKPIIKHTNDDNTVLKFTKLHSIYTWKSTRKTDNEICLLRVHDTTNLTQ